MASETRFPKRIRTSQSLCRLVPPCQSVKHGLFIDSAGQTKTTPIGKYYFTEHALKYDLAALKKGEVYNRDEFYRRAKTWYKAEIDRLLHLEKVEKRRSSAPVPSPAKAPTRVQPTRAAKRKATEQITTSRAPSQPAPIKDTEHAGCDIEPETKGDYTLAAYGWAQFLSGNQEEHGRSAWSYIQFQGLDVAYFCMRLEGAIRRKTYEILSRNGPSYLHMQADGDEKENEANPQLRIRKAAVPNFRCALGDRRYTTPAPFSPKAALAPGEDWRRPTATTTTPVEAAHKTKTANGDPSKTYRLSLIISPSSAGPQTRSAGATTDTEISPTLGRWRIQPWKLEEDGDGSQELPVEDPGANVVEVSGLKFAVDLCACPFDKGLEAGEQGLRVLML
ncbi:hypothetical protein C8A03DRAFT_46856 [Achaetomium macrosporum]|uniref:Uncharacterized protein n=1 Tax=Achaetomium macrosporum TaxID=79813 RepID=A0AAN7H4R5_9PEZI|nr:hypothetical protein C8A03DRAFT_46856 [Achaetomium macrosporum]